MPVRMLGCAMILTAASAIAQTSYPMITHAFPVAVERGKSSEISVFGQQDFAGAFAVLFSGDGVSAEVIGTEVAPANRGRRKNPAKKAMANQPPRVGSVKLRVTVAADAQLGPREFRLATGQGISSVGQLVITDHSVVVEKGAHPSIATAQPIALGRMIAGIIGAKEEVDCYKFAARANQQATFAVVSARLMHKAHDLQNHFDPVVTVQDATGRELASNDDFYLADSMVHCRFASDGDHYITVKDVRFDGDPRWTYALLATDRPYVTSVFPLAVNRTGKHEASATGFALPTNAFSVLVPKNLQSGMRWLQLGNDVTTTNPVLLEATELPMAVENEPNDSIEKADLLTLPIGLNGQLERVGGVDFFAIMLKKGQSIRVEVKARRLGSNLDSELQLYGPAGNVLVSNDDNQRSKDSLLVYTAATEGKHLLRLRDLLGRGGPGYAYFLDARFEEPDFDLVCDDDKASVAGAAGAAWFVKATRRGGFAGPIQVRVEGLPSGVSASPLIIAPSMTQGCIVLSAKPDAGKQAGFVRVVGKTEVATGKETRIIERTARPLEEIYMPGGGRGTLPVDTHAVQVGGRADLLAVRVSPERLTLKPGAKTKLEVEIVRAEHFTGRVTLDLILRHLSSVYADPLPPGVRLLDAGSKLALNPGQTKGTIVLEAAPNTAPISDVPVAVLANVSINFVVKRAYASQPVRVTVAK